MIKIGVKQDAEDKKSGMTLDEIGRFVQQAMSKDVPGETKVEVSIGFSSQIQQIRVES